MRIGRAAVVVLVVVLLAGCGSVSPRGVRSPTRGGSGSGILPPVQSPLRSFGLSAVDHYTIDAAESALSGACLGRFGFTPRPMGTDREAYLTDQYEADTRIYGITDRRLAAVDGYLPASVGHPAPAASGVPGPSDAYLFVLVGVRPGQSGGVAGGVSASLSTASPGSVGGRRIPAGGCLGEARVRLWGSRDGLRQSRFAQELRNAAYDRALTDQRVRRALGDWSACMSASGFSYASPLEVSFPREPGSRPSQVEVTTALADIDCKKKVDLVARWNAVDVEYQAAAVEKNQLALRAERARIDAAVSRAVSILNHG